MTAHTLLDFTGRRSTPLIQQSEASECGLACLILDRRSFLDWLLRPLNAVLKRSGG